MSHSMLSAGVVVTLLVAIQQTSPAQNVTTAAIPLDGRVFGTVVDERSGNPIDGALVVLSDGRTTETDESGRFHFLHVRPGSHQISAITQGCAQVGGSIDVRSGRDALLRLEITLPTRASRLNRSSGSSGRAMGREEMVALGNRSALEALIHFHATTFEVRGNRLVLRGRAGAATEQPMEPLLVLDGVRMDGMIAQALDDLSAIDIERIEVHLGAAAGWAFQPGGATAVLEVTTRKGMANDSAQRPETCSSWKGR
jgi:hypothetical protein